MVSWNDFVPKRNYLSNGGDFSKVFSGVSRYVDYKCLLQGFTRRVYIPCNSLSASLLCIYGQRLRTNITRENYLFKSQYRYVDIVMYNPIITQVTEN